MSAVNRVLIVVVLLVAIPLCTILMVAPVPVFEVVGGQLTALVDYLSRIEWYVRVPMGILFALTMDIIFILLIVLEVRRPSRKAIRVEQMTGGEVTVSVASIADRLKYEVDLLSNVLRCKPKVSAKRGGIVIELDVETAAGINVPAKAEQIVEVAQQVVEEKMGLKLARPPKVNLRAVPYPRASQAPAKPKEKPVIKPEEPEEEEPLASLEEEPFALTGF